MRYRFPVVQFLLITTGVLIGTAAGAQERQIDFDLEVGWSRCVFPQTVQALAHRLDLMVGIEVASGDCPRHQIAAGSHTRLSLTGYTLTQALDALEKFDSRYEWRNESGVIVVRPAAAWNDPETPLNRMVGPVRLRVATALDALLAVLQPLGSRLTGGDARYVDSPDLRRLFSVVFDQPIPAASLLSAIVRSHGRLRWLVEHCTGGNVGDVHVSLQTFDGRAIGSLVAIDGANPLRACEL